MTNLKETKTFGAKCKKLRYDLKNWYFFYVKIPKIGLIEADINEKNNFRSLTDINNRLQYYENKILVNSKYFNVLISAYNYSANK